MIPLISVFDEVSIVAECLILYALGVFFGLLLSFYIKREIKPRLKNKHYAEKEDDED